MKKGHNSDGENLRQYVERIERLKEEQKTIGEDIKEVRAEAKANGFENKYINEVLKLRAMETADREEHETMRDLYKNYLDLV